MRALRKKKKNKKKKIQLQKDTSYVSFQLLKLFTTEYDLDIVLTNLSFTIPSIIYVVKYKTFYSQANRVRSISYTKRLIACVAHQKVSFY